MDWSGLDILSYALGYVALGDGSWEGGGRLHTGNGQGLRRDRAISAV
jgi:hypothetical protein